MGRVYSESRKEQARIRIRRLTNMRRSEFFANKCCIDCGTTENLELDHVDPSTKSGNMCWTWCQEKREAELAKCVIRCRTCHILRHDKNPYTVHGTIAMYDNYKCRCDLCKEAKHRQYEEYKERKPFFWMKNR